MRRYTIYKDLDELLFTAIVEVFRRMEIELAARISDADTLSSFDQMNKLVEGYFEFASQNTKLRSALFDGDLTNTRDVTSWYIEALQCHMRYISGPLMQLHPDMYAEDISLKHGHYSQLFKYSFCFPNKTDPLALLQNKLQMPFIGY